MTKLHELHDNFRVSPWLDNISRSLIQTGQLKSLVEKGIRGVTSNPSIFEKAFSGGEYSGPLKALLSQGKTVEEAYWQLAIEDIQSACDELMQVYSSSNKDDGYVSLEVSPHFARSLNQTIEQAKELWSRVNRPNLMIKVPATEECLPAISELIAYGINVNVTLIFSLHRYLQVVVAYIAGLERLSDPTGVRSVASFFISRVDSEIDPSITAGDLVGLAAVAQARAAYGIFLESFHPIAERWSTLASRGAQPQKPLWASTSTKNPAYSDLKYVVTLLTPNSVNTLPDSTIDAILDHADFSTCASVSPQDIEQAHEQLASIQAHGINMQSVSSKLEIEGLEKFTKAFDDMLSALSAQQ